MKEKNAMNIDEIQTRKWQAEAAILRTVFTELERLQTDTGGVVKNIEIDLVDVPTLSTPKEKKLAGNCKITLNI